jgi:DNA polymerase-3 subunit delta'
LFHPDFSVLERDLKTATSVDATKSFLRNAQVSPFEARGQVFVIASAETLGGGAANALLKTLEEPPDRAPRNFLLLAPSQFDLLPTVRSRSLPVFLGVSDTPDEDRVSDLSRGFAESVRAFAESKDPVYLLAAAEQLLVAGSWKDARSTQPWALAAAAVKASLDSLPPSVDRTRVLALAEQLLDGWQMRLRGIQAQRILEGLVVQHLSSATR